MAGRAGAPSCAAVEIKGKHEDRRDECRSGVGGTRTTDDAEQIRLGCQMMDGGRSTYRQILQGSGLIGAGLTLLLLADLLVFCLNFGALTPALLASTAIGLAGSVLGFYLLRRQSQARGKLAEATAEGRRKQNEVLSLVAHQLRNPLSAVTNALDVLNLLGGPEEAGEEIQLIIQRQVLLMRGWSTNCSTRSA